jgi:hypothetical protein
VVGPATSGRFDALRQIANLVNSLFLLSPLWPVGAVAAWWRPRLGSQARTPAPTGGARRAAGSGVPGGRAGFPLAGIAWLALAGVLAIMMATRARQGPLRDWDVQVGPALVVTLGTAGALVSRWRGSGPGRAALPACAVGLLAALALWGTVGDAGIGERRVHTLLADPSAWSAEEYARAREFLGARAYDAGRYDEAAREYGMAAERAPSPLILDQVAAALGMAGRRQEARRALVRAMGVPQATSSMWMTLAQLALKLDDPGRALACVDSALVRAPGRSDALELAGALRAGLQSRPLTPR